MQGKIQRRIKLNQVGRTSCCAIPFCHVYNNMYVRLEGEVNSGIYTETRSIELFYLALRTDPFSI